MFGWQVVWQIYLVFFRIGAVSFGGGYAMIPFLHQELVLNHAWLSEHGLLDLITISQMTPGPIAINAATYSGYQVAGFWGAVAATLGVVSPSVLLILALAYFFFRYRHLRPVQALLFGVRPAVVVLVAGAGLQLARPVLADWQGLALAGGALLASIRGINPILVLLVAGVLGLLIY